jgi:hypothetical protein
VASFVVVAAAAEVLVLEGQPEQAGQDEFELEAELAMSACCSVLLLLIACLLFTIPEKLKLQ